MKSLGNFKPERSPPLHNLDEHLGGKAARLIQLRQDRFEAERFFMEKTTKDQVNISPESRLWEELSDDAAAAYVGGKKPLSPLLKYVKDPYLKKLVTAVRNYYRFIGKLGEQA